MTSPRLSILFIALFAIICATATLISAQPIQQFETAILIAKPVHSFTILGSTNADGQGSPDRNTGRIAAVLASLFGFCLVLTGLLCLRHHKFLCFAPSPTVSPSSPAKVPINTAAPDSAPQDAMIERQHTMMNPPEHHDEPRDTGSSSFAQSHTEIPVLQQSDLYESQGRSIELVPLRTP